MQATVKRNKRPCVSFLMSRGFTHRTRTVCCIVSLSVAMLGWQQRWLRGFPLMRGVPLNTTWSFGLRKTRGHVGFGYRDFAHWYWSRRVKKLLLWSTPHSHLCSIAVLALGGWCRRSLRPNAMKTLNVFTEGKTGLGLRGQPLHVTEEAVTWGEEVKCARRHGWVWK